MAHRLLPHNRKVLEVIHVDPEWPLTFIDLQNRLDEPGNSDHQRDFDSSKNARIDAELLMHHLQGARKWAADSTEQTVGWQESYSAIPPHFCFRLIGQKIHEFVRIIYLAARSLLFEASLTQRGEQPAPRFALLPTLLATFLQ